MSNETKSKSPKGQITLKEYRATVPVRAWGYAHVFVDAASLSDAQSQFSAMTDDQILDDDNIDWYDKTGDPIPPAWKERAIKEMEEV